MSIRLPIVDAYLQGLREALTEGDRHALSLATGAPQVQLDALRAAYPQCPPSMLDLLGRIDGTYWRTYGDVQISLLMLGSDVWEYPYYLLSAQQMLQEAARPGISICDIYGDEAAEDAGLVDARINASLPMNRRLCFSHCMNNGGTSQLFLDFEPAAGGTVGQVVRFLHDPDSYAVIALDFDSYLQSLIDGGYAFVLDEEA